MSDLYLILHKVRGEPAFDIAQPACATQGHEPCQPNCGCWRDGHCLMKDKWIIPTSGHTAYPFRRWRLDDLADTSDINHFGSHTKPYAYALPANWPDHYPAPSAAEPRSTVAERAKSILSTLGIGAKRVQFRLLKGQSK